MAAGVGVRSARPARRDAGWLLLDDGTAVVEAAAALGLPLVEPDDLDPLEASSRGLGELIVEVLAGEPSALIVCLGGTATVDGGADMRDVVGERLRKIPVRAACDVRNPLLGERGAARVFGPQKGADAAAVEELERRLAAMSELAPFRDLRGAGAGGGSARRSRRSARSSSKARSSCSA